MRKQTKHNKNFLHLKTPILINKKKEKTTLQSYPKFEDQRESEEVMEFINPDSIFDEDNEDDLDEKEIEQLQELSQYNEHLIDLLDKTPEVNHFFNMVPLAFSENDNPSEELGTTYKNSIGSYLTLLLKAESQGVMKEVIDQGFDIEAAQKFALLQLWVKAEDAHEGNIIIGLSDENTMIPISIDFGRCLSFDMDSPIMLPRTTRWEQWPALECNVETNIKNFILSKDPETLIIKLEDLFFNLYNDELTSEQQTLFAIKFHHLHANMIMVQEAIREGLTFKQILALILPVIDGEAFDFVTQGLLQGGDLFSARTRYATLKTAFREAWRNSTAQFTFNSDRFRELIRNEINSIKQLPLEQLNERYYHKMCYELRKGLYL